MSALVAAVALMASTASAEPGAAQAPAGEARSAVDCAVTAKLVNPCRPWLGAVADHYPGASTWREQYEAHEARIGRPVDVVHGYHGPGKVTLSAHERHVVARGSILYLNWKPSAVWADATGGNATVEAQITTMANQIKGLGPVKMMLALSGEPERYTTPGTSACPGLKGTAGSPADYRAMWAHVQDRFNALGVTNVVWVMNYLGYVGWDCLFPELWPGNDRVDWVMWDPYVGPGRRWDSEIGYFYNAMEARSDAAHAFTSKPWGLAEYGYWYGTDGQTKAYRMYDEARAALEANRFPRLKLYEVYDTISNGVDIRVGYDHFGVPDPAEQAAYNVFANHPIFSDPVVAPTTTDHFAACDVRVETGLSCFAGIYSGSVRPTLQGTDGHTGQRSAQVTNTGPATATLGLNTKPVAVGSTAVGTTYSGGVWVKASRVGLPVTLLVREKRPGTGTAPANGYKSTTWTAPHLGWQQLAATYVGKEAGNTLTYSVYASQLAPGQWLRADDFSLTSQPA